MDRNTFITMSPKKGLQEVNKLLKELSLAELSERLGIPTGSFSKLLRDGDYLYHQADKQYYPFVRSEEDRVKKSQSKDLDEVTFIKEHIATLKKVVQQFEEQGLLILDKQIYSKNGDFVNKSIRMNSTIYEDFTNFCDEHFPHLKTQDVIAQALIDAMNRYQPETKREL